MESQSHNQLKLKVSRFFPSSLTSCQFRTLPDVAEGSITITKPNRILQENDRSTTFSNKPAYRKKLCKSDQLLRSDSSKFSTLKTKKMEKNVNRECSRKNSALLFNQSSSSNSAWFTDEDGGGGGDGDTFFSLSSNSGDSFRLKTYSRRFRRCEEMKSIDETGRCSFSSIGSSNTVLSKCSSRRRIQTAAVVKTTGGKKCSEIRRENEMGSDHFSTEVYYSKNGGGSERRRSRRQRTAKNSRKMKKHPPRRSFNGGACGMAESYALEKISGDPRGDFRASMVEMIVEKQIFGADDLQRLLICFLSLNDVAYHGMIYDVFNEICQTLFTN